MNWPRPCNPRAAVLVDELQLTDAQWQAYLQTLRSRSAAALAAAARWLEERPG